MIQKREKNILWPKRHLCLLGLFSLLHGVPSSRAVVSHPACQHHHFVLVLFLAVSFTLLFSSSHHFFHGHLPWVLFLSSSWCLSWSWPSSIVVSSVFIISCCPCCPTTLLSFCVVLVALSGPLLAVGIGGGGGGIIDSGGGSAVMVMAIVGCVGRRLCNRPNNCRQCGQSSYD
jgi:hypothetical protein